MIRNKSEYVKAKNRLMRKLQVLKSMLDKQYNYDIEYLISCLKENSWCNYDIHHINYDFLTQNNLDPVRQELEELERYVINTTDHCDAYDVKYKLVRDITIGLDDIYNDPKLKPLYIYINNLYILLDKLCGSLQYTTTITIHTRFDDISKASEKLGLYNSILFKTINLEGDFLELYKTIHGFKYELI